MDKTPDHTVFCKIRQKKIGAEKLVLRLFSIFKGQLQAQGYMGEVFVDASHLISKVNLWEERDEARKKKYDKLNHKTLPKVAVTPANVTDAQGFEPVAPQQGAVYADKGYCTNPARTTAAQKGGSLSCG